MEKFFKIVEETFEIDRITIDESTIINELEAWNSLKHMEFIFCLEEQFGVAFSGDEIAEFRTLGDIIKVIN
jgi:acyl carrier protein